MGKFKNRLNQHFVSSWWVYLFLILFFLAGLAFGTMGVTALGEQQASSLQQYVKDGLLQLKDGPDFAQIATIAWEKNTLAIGKILLLGLTILGLPLILVIIFTRGFVLGFSLVFLLQGKTMLDKSLMLLAVLPPNFLSLPALFFAGVLAVNFSLYLLRGRDASRTPITQYLLGYFLLFICLFLLMTAAAFLEGYFSPFIYKMLNVSCIQ